mgnify:CR=1 FL=1
MPIIRITGDGNVITFADGPALGSPILSLYCANKNIRVNTVHSGMTDTDMANRMAEDLEIGPEIFTSSLCEAILIARYGQSKDISGWRGGSKFFRD